MVAGGCDAVVVAFAGVTRAFLFMGASTFDQPLKDWDVSSVTNMLRMFKGASKFNQPLNGWTVSSVTVMSHMFRSSNFNQPPNDWDVGSVGTMLYMFSQTNFNQPPNNWTSIYVHPIIKLLKILLFLVEKVW